ncbi:hypothetical protein N7468_000058 [Penicillium chermesinum]|uniref:Uncharacterized protein n=1 Tax=Penicillium chermesinum TaxID=63820 RepID=A0A9W9PJL7_9EURO|nr:uncharacterized protein N7468_000058 [Penicillium chermesinum]KAJ5248607.1 hypothetical protein N7468_000058 [Penicillium chermesinum]
MLRHNVWLTHLRSTKAYLVSSLSLRKEKGRGEEAQANGNSGEAQSFLAYLKHTVLASRCTYSRLAPPSFLTPVDPSRRGQPWAESSQTEHLHPGLSSRPHMENAGMEWRLPTEWT